MASDHEDVHQYYDALHRQADLHADKLKTIAEQEAYQQADELKALIFARTSLRGSDLVCPREKSEMTPCIARDGHLAVAFTSTGFALCVGCEAGVKRLLAFVVMALGVDGGVVGAAREESTPATPNDDPSQSTSAGVEATDPLRALIARLREMAHEQNMRQQAVYTAFDIRDAAEREDVLLSAASKLEALLAAPEAEE
jgi:hypothetical protein